MKVKDILETKHTVLASTNGWTNHNVILSDYTQTDLTLRQILFQFSYKYKDAIDYLRSIKDEKEQKKHKLNYPCWYVGGTIPLYKQKDEDLITLSNIVAIDIDYSPNPHIDFDKLKVDIFKLPYVFFVSKSIRGKGIYALMLVEDGNKTSEYFEYITKLWKQKFNIVTDKQTKNIGRKRYISYDDDYMIKSDDTEISKWTLYALPQKLTITSNSKPSAYYSKTKTASTNNDFTHKAIWHMLNNGYSIDNINTENKYAKWYYIACEFKRFNDGFDMFYKFSNNSSKYNDDYNTIKKKYDSADVNKISDDDVAKNWQGLCKNTYGKDWWRQKTTNIFK